MGSCGNLGILRLTQEKLVPHTCAGKANIDLGCGSVPVLTKKLSKALSSNPNTKREV